MSLYDTNRNESTYSHRLLEILRIAKKPTRLEVLSKTVTTFIEIIILGLLSFLVRLIFLDILFQYSI